MRPGRDPKGMIKRKAVNDSLSFCRNIMLEFHVPDQCACAENGRVGFFQVTDKELYFILVYLDEIAFHVITGWLQDEIACLCEATKEDDGFGAGEHHENGQCEAEDLAGEVE